MVIAGSYCVFRCRCQNRSFIVVSVRVMYSEEKESGEKNDEKGQSSN
jgi:hypothetical protein